MTRTAKILLAATAIVGLTGAVGWAQMGNQGMGQMMHGRGMGPMGGPMMGGMDRFEQADTDKNGEVSAEEFAAAFNMRLANADANNDGVYAPEEIAAEIQRQRDLAIAQRMIDRMDIDNDGKLSKTEVDTHKQQMFAWLDGNNDGKITRDEMPQMNMRHGGRQGGWGGGGWGGGRHGGHHGMFDMR